MLAITCGLFAIWVHSWQALHNHNTVRWNGGDWGPILGDINIDQDPEYLWDWRHPQMLASEASLARRYRSHQGRRVPLLLPGQTLDADADPRHFIGWHDVEGEGDLRWRWSEGRWDGGSDEDLPRIAFSLPPEIVSPSAASSLWLEAGTFEAQRAELWLNGHRLGHFEPAMHFEPLRQSFPLPSTLLEEHNQLEIRLPDARAAGAGDGRILGMAVHRMGIERLED
jgi:hypothetical protein